MNPNLTSIDTDTQELTQIRNELSSLKQGLQEKINVLSQTGPFAKKPQLFLAKSLPVKKKIFNFETNPNSESLKKKKSNSKPTILKQLESQQQSENGSNSISDALKTMTQQIQTVCTLVVINFNIAILDYLYVNYSNNNKATRQQIV